MAKLGRPSKLTPERLALLEDSLRAGNYVETSAAYAGISKVTFYAWLKRGRAETERVRQNPRSSVRKSEQIYVDFLNAVEKANADAEVRFVALIAQAASEQWQAAGWYLERRYPHRWGRRVHEVQDGGDAPLPELIAASYDPDDPTRPDDSDLPDVGKSPDSDNED